VVLYDVSTGAPAGAFRPLAGAVKATSVARSLKTFPVEVRDGRDLAGRLSDGRASSSRPAPRSRITLTGV
jgi:hypothetical protein